jgi:hypothetical protein
MTLVGDQGLRGEFQEHRGNTTNSVAAVGNALGDPRYLLPAFGTGYLVGQVIGDQALSRVALRAGGAALESLDLWGRQLVVDSEAGDRDAMIGDAATLRWIRDRIARDVSPAELAIIDARIADLRTAAEAGAYPRVAVMAKSFRSTLARTRIRSLK